MKMMIVVALALVAAAAALPAGPDPGFQKVVDILKSDFDQKPDGEYLYGFESSDGTKKEEQGTLREVFDEEKKPHKVVTVRGQFTYINSFGEPETITYEADENGFRAEGKSIPKNASR